jgi:hypothetical protein
MTRPIARRMAQVEDSKKLLISRTPLPKSSRRKCGHKHRNGKLHFVKCEGRYRRYGFECEFKRTCKHSFCVYCYQPIRYADPVTGTVFVYFDGFFPIRCKELSDHLDRLYLTCVDCDLFFRKRKTDMSQCEPERHAIEEKDFSKIKHEENVRAREFAFRVQQNPELFVKNPLYPRMWFHQHKLLTLA